MAKLSITISMDNAAFEDGELEYEVCRILRVLSAKLEENGVPRATDDPWPIFDNYGNQVGRLKVTR